MSLVGLHALLVCGRECFVSEQSFVGFFLTIVGETSEDDWIAACLLLSELDSRFSAEIADEARACE